MNFIRKVVLYGISIGLGIIVAAIASGIVGLIWPAAASTVFDLLSVGWILIGWSYAKARDKGELPPYWFTIAPLSTFERLNFETGTDAEIERRLWLRAVEWAAWPAFVTQPIIPILFVFFSPLSVIIGLLIADFLWRFVRYSFVSLGLATRAVLFVSDLKWLCSIGATVYLLTQQHYTTAILAFLWLFLSGFVSSPVSLLSALFGRHTEVGRIELEFAKRIGYMS